MAEKEKISQSIEDIEAEGVAVQNGIEVATEAALAHHSSFADEILR